MIKHDTIAVVGMDGLFPGASSLDQYWQNIVNRNNASREVPPHRWISAADSVYRTDYQLDKTNSIKACLLDKFDPDLSGLNIDSRLVKELDPLYQIVLHVGKRAFMGSQLSQLDPQRIGVILAAIALPTDGSSTLARETFGYIFKQKVLSKPVIPKPLTVVGALNSRVVGYPASLLAQALELGGGSYTLDAACASSLYAIKLACDELISGRADAMITGGVSRPDCLYTQIGFTQLQAISPSGVCSPFDQRANGLVVGEGAGIVILKRLEDALKDGDEIYALIKGIGLSNDIGGNLLSPSSEGQLRALQAAYQKCSWSPNDVDFIECHGTGTPIGDETELKSLKKLWENLDYNSTKCAIGSVKSIVGHLLTAAGAAAFIKTVLALKNKTIPPSANFDTEFAIPELQNSPFRIPVQAEEWKLRDGSETRKAAINAFGFGGINSHVLIEEWPSDREINLSSNYFGTPEDISFTNTSNGTDGSHGSHGPNESLDVDSSSGTSEIDPINEPIAVVGMEVHIGAVECLKSFQEKVFSGSSIIKPCSSHRFYGEDLYLQEMIGSQLPGAYIEFLDIPLGKFPLPPNEVEQILPQQLLMLKVAAGALDDADIDYRVSQPRVGTTIGTNFDLEATNFHLRWSLERQVGRWAKELGLSLNAEQLSDWIQQLRDSLGPPLNNTRTVGALGGIVASRVAKSLRLGGPSFIVSSEDASGIKALQIGIQSLRQNETDVFLVGAVELTGDLRQLLARNIIRSYSSQGEIKPFDKNRDGGLPGEGAVALVLKRSSDAMRDGNKIYSIIKGVGNSFGINAESNAATIETYTNALQQAYEQSSLDNNSNSDMVDDLKEIGYLEAHGSGEILEDQIEQKAFQQFFLDKKLPCALGSLRSIVGDTGAVAGLASVTKASLCLYNRIVPPLNGFESPDNDGLWDRGLFHIPKKPQFWYRNADEGKRKAGVSSMTFTGDCSHVVLEEFDQDNNRQYNNGKANNRFNLEPTDLESISSSPMGNFPYGLFLIKGKNVQDLISRLDDLESLVKDSKLDVASIACNWYHLNNQETDRNQQIKNQKIDHSQRGQELPNQPLTASLVAKTKDQLKNSISLLSISLKNDSYSIISDSHQGIYYHHAQTAISNISNDGSSKLKQVAFVYPGSGNNYLEMGRELAVRWPHIMNSFDNESSCLKEQFLPDIYLPWRCDWSPGWGKDAENKLRSDPLNMIFGQVTYGCLMTQVLKQFGLFPSNVIGYSLGESVGYFAFKVWPDLEEMLHRMKRSPLFKTDLTNFCSAAREIWQIPENQEFEWHPVLINVPAYKVEPLLNKNDETVRLLIINTDDECVIGGNKKDVEKLVDSLQCEAFPLSGMITVHCEALEPVKDAYFDLHMFPVTNVPKGINFYSCAHQGVIDVNSSNTAESITQGALECFNFPATIRQAYEDGVRVFIEVGPGASCTRMIKKILQDKPHLAVTASSKDQNEDELFSLFNMLAKIAAEGVDLDLSTIYGTQDEGFLDHKDRINHEEKNKSCNWKKIRLGGAKSEPVYPSITQASRPSISEQIPPTSEKSDSTSERSALISDKVTPKFDLDTSVSRSNTPILSLWKVMEQQRCLTINTHEAFLRCSQNNLTRLSQTYFIQTDILNQMIGQNIEVSSKKPLFDRDLCMEFAVGSVAKVLGPEFAIVDEYPVRVRLPDEPYMFVDRIMSIKGKKVSLTSGQIITEHDVLPNAWYLDNGIAPTSITVEAGQADLFLSSYLGIDLAVKGNRSYRLLDATVEFFRQLPRPGETIRFIINIDKFIKQVDTYLFFFNFKGYIDGKLLISMTNGCAGFFTPLEVQNSGGIIEDKNDNQTKLNTIGEQDRWPLTVTGIEKYDDKKIEALREGRLAECFGTDFDSLSINKLPGLPGGRMTLIHRVLELNQAGGKYGLGIIKAQADIHPDDWFLTCHFVDDMVMPGTLMFECCAHTLRVFLLRMGWVGEDDAMCYEPVLGIKTVLRCRGPVTAQTQKVLYQIDIKKVAYDPIPYVIADAIMYADNKPIVSFKDMSMQCGLSKDKIFNYFNHLTSAPESPVSTVSPVPPLSPMSPLSLKSSVSSVSQSIFTYEQFEEFAIGSPAKAFGERYKIFDKERIMARLPGPPYLFNSRITKCDLEPWVLKAGGWVEGEYDVPLDAWYFKENRQESMAFCILLEVVLQTCGWTAAYLGSALISDVDLKFRNLEGEAVLYKEIFPEIGTLKIRINLNKVSRAKDTLIQDFYFELYTSRNEIIYKGSTTFGFFGQEALINQVGIRDVQKRAFQYDPDSTLGEKLLMNRDSLPGKKLLMLDQIDLYLPNGGRGGLGYICGSKKVDPDEWFFKAHFYQDPVCPGSLGVEAFLQLIKVFVINRWTDKIDHMRFTPTLIDVKHKWTYRGQVLPSNERMEIEAEITELVDGDEPLVKANGFLKVDGLYIYEMINFGIRLI